MSIIQNMYLFVTDKMYICQICGYQSRQLVPYLQHQQFHSNLSQYWHCGYNGCKKQFRLQGSLRAHLLRTHVVLLSSKNNKNSSPFRIARTQFICSVQLCKKVFSSSNAVIQHLKDHIRSKEKIKCPFQNCNNEYNIVPSFSGHLSKNHTNPSSSSTSRSTVNATTCSLSENAVVTESVIDEQSNFTAELFHQNFNNNVDDHDDTRQ